MRHPEDLADFMQIEIGALELESRSSRRYFQVRNLREGIEYFLGNAITEVGSVFVVAQIFEWQHRDAFPGNCGRFGATRTGIYSKPYNDREKTSRSKSRRQSRQHKSKCISVALHAAGIASAVSVRLIPCGVSSNIHANTSATGRPRMMSSTIARIAELGMSKSGKTCAIP